MTTHLTPISFEALTANILVRARDLWERICGYEFDSDACSIYLKSITCEGCMVQLDRLLELGLVQVGKVSANDHEEPVAIWNKGVILGGHVQFDRSAFRGIDTDWIMSAWPENNPPKRFGIPVPRLDGRARR